MQNLKVDLVERRCAFVLCDKLSPAQDVSTARRMRIQVLTSRAGSSCYTVPWISDSQVRVGSVWCPIAVHSRDDNRVEPWNSSADPEWSISFQYTTETIDC